MPKEGRKKKHNAVRFPCPDENCTRWFRNHSGLRKHVKCYHPVDDLSEDDLSVSDESQVNSDKTEDVLGSGAEEGREEGIEDSRASYEDNEGAYYDDEGIFHDHEMPFEEGDLETPFEEEDHGMPFEEESDSDGNATYRNTRIYHPVMTGTWFIFVSLYLTIARNE